MLWGEATVVAVVAGGVDNLNWLPGAVPVVKQRRALTAEAWWREPEFMQAQITTHVTSLWATRLGLYLLYSFFVLFENYTVSTTFKLLFAFLLHFTQRSPFSATQLLSFAYFFKTFFCVSTEFTCCESKPSREVGPLWLPAKKRVCWRMLIGPTYSSAFSVMGTNPFFSFYKFKLKMEQKRRTYKGT